MSGETHVPSAVKIVRIADNFHPTLTPFNAHHFAVTETWLQRNFQELN